MQNEIGFLKQIENIAFLASAFHKKPAVIYEFALYILGVLPPLIPLNKQGTYKVQFLTISIA